MYFNASANQINKRVFIAKGYAYKGGAGSSKIVYSAASGFSSTEGVSGFSGTWGGFAPSNGRELESAQAQYPEVDTVILLRHKSDLKTIDKIVYEGRSFFIVAIINPNEGNRFIQVYCKEIKE